MLNGLDLFSGIGGITIALSEWVRPIAYCENDRYAQSVLLSNMRQRNLPNAPIWDDVQTLTAESLPFMPDIIYGGFPCQNISVAGDSKGLAGKRSGLFQEIVRLVEETQPAFVFLENVPAITTRGLDVVLSSFTKLRYDCRWTIVSAAEVGAPHLRKRWFFLAANPNSIKLWNEQGWRCGTNRDGQAIPLNNGKKEFVADSMCEGLEGQRQKPIRVGEFLANSFDHRWWEAEPSVRRVVDELSNRSHRIKCLGNAVVPSQAKEAFKRLCGLK